MFSNEDSNEIQWKGLFNFIDKFHLNNDCVGIVLCMTECVAHQRHLLANLFWFTTDYELWHHDIGGVIFESYD